MNAAGGIIDPTYASDCGLGVHVCPVNAIFAPEDLPPQWKSFIEKNAAFYRE